MSIDLSFKKILTIATKDIKTYYSKPPSLFYGIVLPFALFGSFLAGRPCVTEDYRVVGVTALSTFFGGTTIAAVILPLERRSGTIDRLILAPVSFKTLLLGKSLAGFTFSFPITLLVLSIILPFTGFWNLNPLLLVVSIALSVVFSCAFGLAFSASANDVADVMWPMNFVRFLMIFFSGVFMPIDEIYLYMPSLKFIAYLLPLTYSVDAVYQSIVGINDVTMLIADFAILISITIVLYYIAYRRFIKTLT
ncbi:MAG: ABC transporter permease [Candidatus Bathyarchaeia archaeon]